MNMKLNVNYSAKMDDGIVYSDLDGKVYSTTGVKNLSFKGEFAKAKIFYSDGINAPVYWVMTEFNMPGPKGVLEDLFYTLIENLPKDAKDLKGIEKVTNEVMDQFNCGDGFPSVKDGKYVGVFLGLGLDDVF
jgi:hypothetical protein